MDYRIEQKFLCDQKDYALIKSRIENIMYPDNTSKTGNLYQVRSVYFDDMYSSKFNENEQGVDDREKYRIRIYNHDKSFIRFERKSKLNGYTNKKSFVIDEKKYNSFMSEDFDFTPSEIPLENEIQLNIMMYKLAPSIIVEYTREVFAYDVGNVRITFDSNIAVSNDFDRFFDEDIKAMPVLNTGEFILEVKYDEILPKTIASALDLGSLQQTTFSKFYMGKLQTGLMEGGYKNGYTRYFKELSTR